MVYGSTRWKKPQNGITHIFEVAATFIAMKNFSKMKKNTQSCMKDYIFAAGKSRNTLSLRC